jgi:hypothetical protein
MEVVPNYSSKSFAVYGNTEPYEDTLRMLGGKKNRNLKGRPGWIFSNTKYESVMQFINQVQQKTVPIQIYRYDDQSIAIIGDATPYQDQFLQIGGRLFQMEDGRRIWIFSNDKYESLRLILNPPITLPVTPPVTPPVNLPIEQKTDLNQVYIGPDGAPVFKMYYGLYLLRRGYVTYGDLMKYKSLEVGQYLADLTKSQRLGPRYLYHDSVTKSLLLPISSKMIPVEDALHLLPIVNGQFGQYSSAEEFSKGASKYIKMYNLDLQKVVDVRILKHGHLRNGKNVVNIGLPFAPGYDPKTPFDTFVDHPLINQPMTLQQLLYGLGQSLEDVGGIVLKHSTPYSAQHYSHSENITYYLILVRYESSGGYINFIANFCQNNLTSYPDAPGRSNLPDFRRSLITMPGDQIILSNLLPYASENLVKDDIIISVNDQAIGIGHSDGTLYQDMKITVSNFVFDFDGSWQIEPYKII